MSANTTNNTSAVLSLRWENGNLYILDQTRLPIEIVEIRLDSIEQVWEAIQQLRVRGAPAIGVAAAYGLVVGMKPLIHLDLDKFLVRLKENAGYLNSSRPTAVNLSWALRRMQDFATVQSPQVISASQLYARLVDEAVRIHQEDRAICRAIGENGLPLIRDGMGVLTHCNAGALATSELGTATAPLYLAHERGMRFRVYSDETRPLLQGARLTTWELQRAGLDVTLICDNMAAFVMSQGLVDLCIVGCDRVAANGDAANKIGTLGVAIIAQHYNIPFYVACPSSTVDLQTATGREIVIEERAADEVLFFGARRTGPEGAKVCNPSFDVTPHELIAGFITDRGIIQPPYAESLAQHFG
ncbi:MAG: S-methyl-5-thioribose-1-phosphate isomerase [Betaproteobacteria bacterium]|nr:S-methyl-5-thioribose-1-phosphate isomerase [Betaproteobacteria bacterium]